MSDAALRYKMRLLIHHPNMDPSVITKKLGLTPTMAGIVGEPLTGRDGNPLPRTRHHTSVWSYGVRVDGNRDFFDEVDKLIDVVEPHGAFLAKLIEEGARVTLIFDLPGDVNIGDVIKWGVMARLAALRINLGIEVFPRFN